MFELSGHLKILESTANNFDAIDADDPCSGAPDGHSNQKLDHVLGVPSRERTQLVLLLETQQLINRLPLFFCKPFLQQLRSLGTITILRFFGR